MWEQTKSTFLEAAGRVLQAVARLLPSILAMVIFLVLTALVAWIASTAVRRAGVRLEVDRRLREWGMAAPASAGHVGPTMLAARITAWAIVALGLVASLNVFESTVTTAISERLLEYVPHVLVALAVFAGGVAGARAVERSVLIGAVNMGLHSARLLGLGARWLLLILASTVALEHLGVGGTTLTSAFAITFGGIVLALSLAVGLGAREIVAKSLERRFSNPADAGDARGDGKVHHL